MPIEKEQASPGRMPGVSVADAFNLPKDWSLAESLKGNAGTGAKGGELEVEVEKVEGTPEPEELERQKQAEKDAAAAKKTEIPENESEIDRDKREAAEVETARKQKELDAAKAKGGKPADGAKPAAKPAEKVQTPEEKAAAEKKAKEAAAAKPAAPAKPAAAAAKPGEKAAPVIPPLGSEKKFKVGDKEYTEKELADLIAGKKPAEAAKPAEKVQTPEEKAAAEKAVQEKETNWISETAKGLAVPALDEATLDVILTGGKEAVAAMENIRRQDMATTLLGARKDILQQLSPIIKTVTDMEQRHFAAEDAKAEQEIIGLFPALAPHTDLLKQHAWALSKQLAEEGKGPMPQADFNKLVGELTVAYIQKYNPDFGQAAADPGAGGEAAAPDPGAAAAAAAAKPATGAAKPAPQKRVTPPAPGGNIPGGQPAAGGKGGGKDFAKGAIASLL